MNSEIIIAILDNNPLDSEPFVVLCKALTTYLSEFFSTVAKTSIDDRILS